MERRPAEVTGAGGGAGWSEQDSKWAEIGSPPTATSPDVARTTAIRYERCEQLPSPMGPASTTLATTTASAPETGAPVGAAVTAAGSGALGVVVAGDVVPGVDGPQATNAGEYASPNVKMSFERAARLFNITELRQTI